MSCYKKSKKIKKLPSIRSTHQQNTKIEEKKTNLTHTPKKIENKFQELKKNINSTEETSTNLSIKLKERGNKYYSEGKYLEAIDYYTKAINIDSSNSSFWGNRALCYLNLQDALKCERDCNMAISLDPNNLKNFLRRGHARKLLQKYAQSLEGIYFLKKQKHSEIKHQKLRF